MNDILGRTKRGAVRLVETDWSSLSEADSVAHLHVQGFTVLPRLLDPPTMAQVKAELADLKMNVAPYSEQQKFAADSARPGSATEGSLDDYMNFGK